MPIKSQIDPVGTTIKLFMDQAISPAAQSKVFAAFVKGGISAASDANRKAGVTAAPVVTVDGRKGASIDDVRPNGAVVAEWQILTPALLWIWGALRDSSPRLSGKYRDGHMLTCDGREIAWGDAIPSARDYVFSNVEPYAHRIEIGKTRSGRDFEVRVPNRIYQRIAVRAAAAFPALDIQFDDTGKSPTITVTVKAT